MSRGHRSSRSRRSRRGEEEEPEVISSESEEEEGAIKDSEDEHEDISDEEEEEEEEDSERDSESGEEEEEGEEGSSEEGEESGSESEVERSRSRSRRHRHHKSSSSSSKKRKKEKKEKKEKKKRKKSKHRSHRQEEERRSHRHRRSRRDQETESEQDETDTEGGADTDAEREMSTPELPEIEETEINLEKEPGEEEEEEEVREVVEETSSRSKRRQRDNRESREKDSRDNRDRRMRDSRTREEPRRRDRESREKEERSSRRNREEKRSRRRGGGRSRSRSPRDSRSHRDKPNERDQQEPPPPKDPEQPPVNEEELGGPLPGGSADTTSLSVEDTNKLRASLGLAPLKVAGSEQSKAETEEHEARAKEFGGTLIPGSNKNEILIPAENLSEKSLAEKLRERIAQRREKRKQEAKLLLVKKLGDSDSEDEGAAGWIKKQKRAAKEKAEAAKRAKMLEELDDEFGVGSMVAEESKKDRAREYGKDQLSGLKVEHNADHFDAGKSVILTLKDADVLDEEAKDTLLNVNMADDDRTRKKLDDAKKARTGYNAYDDEEVDELTGEVRRKGMLAKYDEEIDGVMQTNFTIGAKGTYSEEEEVRKQKEAIKAKLAATKNMVSLELPKLKVASDYYTKEEADAKFKKPKKKKKVKRRLLKADDLVPLDDQEGNLGSRSGGKKKATASATSSSSVPMDVDDDNNGGAMEVKTENTMDLSKVKVEEDEDDMELARALQRSRKLKQRAATRVDPAERLMSEAAAASTSSEVDFSSLPTIKTEVSEERTGSEFISTFDDLGGSDDKMIILNETAEFCRNLGARQFNDFADRKMAAKSSGVKDDVDEELRTFEESLKSRETLQFEANQRERGRWAVVEDEEDDLEADRRRMDVDDDTDTDTEDNSREQRRRRKKDKERSAILEEEPDLQSGVAAAIKLASSKGYWEQEAKANSGSTLKHLQAKNYTIDDKMRSGGYDDDRRGRDRGGPTTSFDEKPDYKPNVQLEYIDDGGRLMNQKEAFRYLSHKFHGKTSGKLKTEKRMKKHQEDSLMKNMSSTDTPLNTLDKLKKKTKECATPYLVLSGNKINPQDLKK